MGGTLVFCERCLPMMLSLRKGNVDLATAHVGAGALTRPAERSFAVLPSDTGHLRDRSFVQQESCTAKQPPGKDEGDQCDD